jgi:hypothetical protein
MTMPTIDIGVGFGLADAGEFVVGSSLVGGADVIGDGLNSVMSAGFEINISRGRFSQLWDSLDAGSCRVALRNNDRDFDPLHATSPYYGQIVPGRRIEVSANGYVIWTGYVNDWDLEYSIDGISTAFIQSTDALGMFGQLQFDAWTNTATTIDGKLDAICDRSEVAWPDTARDFSGADIYFSVLAPITLQSDAVSWGSNVLNYCQLIARSNLGYFFASRTGNLTFRSRNIIGTSYYGDYTLIPAFGAELLLDEYGSPILDEDGQFTIAESGGIPFRGIAASVGSDRLFARVSVDREGGTAQTSTVADTTAWIIDYGPLRSLAISGLLMDSDAQSGYLADELLALYEEPVYRISEIEVDITPLSSTDQDTVLALDITDRVVVSFQPNGVGASITQELVIQGISHSISVERHVVTFSLQVRVPLTLGPL